MNEAVVSIVVPVYKVEQYLHRCVDSILSQTFRDFELILVDDGSPDNCPRICDEYALKDKRIHVLHQKNSGAAAARNAGIDWVMKNSSSQWISFVDSDDWIVEEQYQVLWNHGMQSNMDVVLFQGMAVHGGACAESMPQKQPTEIEVVDRSMFTPEFLIHYAGVVWCYLYRRSLIETHHIRFPVGLKFSEDRVFNIRALGYANGMVKIHRNLYMYCYNSESVVNSYHADFYEHVVRANECERKAIAEVWGDDPEYHLIYDKQFFNDMCAGIRQYSRAKTQFFFRIGKIWKICSNKKLRTVIADHEYGEKIGKWILSKRVITLYAYFKMENSALKEKFQNALETLHEGGILGVIRKVFSKIIQR